MQMNNRYPLEELSTSTTHPNLDQFKWKSVVRLSGCSEGAVLSAQISAAGNLHSEALIKQYLLL